jgi:hypothetical protein
MADSLHSLRRARAQQWGSPAALAEELASVILTVFDAMRAAGAPPNDGDRARARRLLLDELNYCADAVELAAVVRTVFDTMREIGAPPSKSDRMHVRRMMGGASRQVADGHPRGPQSRS